MGSSKVKRARVLRGKKKAKWTVLRPHTVNHHSIGGDIAETRKSSRVSGLIAGSSSSSSSRSGVSGRAPPKKATTRPVASVDANASPSANVNANVEVVIFKFTETDPLAVAFQKQLNTLAAPPVTLAVGTGNLTTLPVGFRFIDHLALSKGATPFDTRLSVSCTCTPGATSCTVSSKCCCYDQAGGFAYGRLGMLREGRSSTSAIIECGQHCLCMGCGNRVVQQGRQIPLEIFWAGTKGWGLRCPEKLCRGSLVDKYTGQVVGPREASRRANINAKIGTTYLLTLNKFDTPRGKHHAIDSEHCGGVARFINHSCAPNLTAYAVVSDRRDWKVYDIAFFANRDINAGEELTYDYVGRIVGDMDGDRPGWKCLCGSENCRASIF